MEPYQAQEVSDGQHNEELLVATWESEPPILYTDSQLGVTFKDTLSSVQGKS